MRNRQKEIITTLGVQPEIDTVLEIERRTQFLVDWLARTGLRGFALGISGGQDSLLAGLFAQKAAQKRRDDGFDASFHAALLPYGVQADREDAQLAINFIQPDFVHDFNIKQGVDGIAAGFEASEGRLIADYEKGNVKARARMIAQYALASDYGLLVVGTDHAAEAVTGFFTKFGDGGADVLPLSGLSKRQGKAILRTLGAPERFITKAPTADLLDGRPGQTDEDELGLTYDILDDYLEGLEVPEEAADKIEARYAATQHKRDLPIAFTDIVEFRQ